MATWKMRKNCIVCGTNPPQYALQELVTGFPKVRAVTRKTFHLKTHPEWCRYCLPLGTRIFSDYAMCREYCLLIAEKLVDPYHIIRHKVAVRYNGRKKPRR